MFISNVDAGLEGLVRARLPLSEEIGDVSFDPPTGTWGAQLSRITVSMFLYEVRRSSQPSRAAISRTHDGARQRRRPQPMMELGYLVSAWAGSPRDEHQLLGELMSLLATVEVIPAEHFPRPPTTTAHLSLGDSRHTVRELWAAMGGHLRSSATLVVTVGADSFDWELEAPGVDRIEAIAERMSAAPPAAGTARRPR